MTYHRTFHLLAALLISPLSSSAQSFLPTDDEVASIVRNWRWETDDGTSTIDVSSSRWMLFEGKLQEFTLAGGAIRFVGDSDVIPYRYDAVKNRLTLNFPGGTLVEYGRTIRSVLARRGTRRLPEQAEFLIGRFSTQEQLGADSEPVRRTINFQRNMEFDFGPGGYEPVEGADAANVSPAALGTALVFKDVVIFSFYDSTAAEAEVRTRNVRGEVESFIYADEVYTSESRGTAILSSPTPYPPEPVPGPPPPHPIPPYYPPIYYPPTPPPYEPPVIVVTPPSSPPPPSGREKEGEKRTVGRTRGESGGRSGSSGRSGSTGSSGGSGGNRGSSGRGGNRR